MIAHCLHTCDIKVYYYQHDTVFFLENFDNSIVLVYHPIFKQNDIK